MGLHIPELQFTLTSDFLKEVVFKQQLQTYKIARFSGDDLIFVVPRSKDMRLVALDLSQGTADISGLATVAMIGAWQEGGCSLQFFEEMPDYRKIIDAGYRRTEIGIETTVSLLEEMLIAAGGRGIKRVYPK